jgi:hypothetical protein
MAYFVCESCGITRIVEEKHLDLAVAVHAQAHHDAERNQAKVQVYYELAKVPEDFQRRASLAKPWSPFK